jgi:hypothetical protein
MSLGTYIGIKMTGGLELASLLTTGGHEEAVTHFMDVSRAGRFGPGNNPFNIHAYIGLSLLVMNKDQDSYDFLMAWAHLQTDRARSGYHVVHEV